MTFRLETAGPKVRNESSPMNRHQRPRAPRKTRTKRTCSVPSVL